MAKGSSKAAGSVLSLENIATIVEAAPPKKNGSLAQRMVQGVADLTAVDRVIDDLEDAASLIKEAIRTEAITYFLNEGCQTAKLPGNYKACEAEFISGTSVQHALRVELSRSGKPLSEEAKAQATEHEIPVEKVTSRNAAYILNPKFSENVPLMQVILAVLNAGMPKIEAAMAAAGLAGENVLEFQPAKSTTVTTNETLPAIFKQPREMAEILLPMFSEVRVGWCEYNAPIGQDGLVPALLRTGAIINQPKMREAMIGKKAEKKAEKKAAEAARQAAAARKAAA